MLDHYPKDHTDFEDCLAARDRLGETLLEVLTVLNQAVREFFTYSFPEINNRLFKYSMFFTYSFQTNLVQLCELQRDIIGFDNLVQEGRRFIRQGCLHKFNRKGFQQRMFFLVKDLNFILYNNHVIILQTI